MDWLVVPKGGHVLDDTKCDACDKKLKAGEVVAFTVKRPAAGVTVKFVQHKRCLAAMFDEVPMEVTELDFQRLREQILESGDIFLEA